MWWDMMADDGSADEPVTSSPVDILYQQPATGVPEGQIGEDRGVRIDVLVAESPPSSSEPSPGSESRRRFHGREHRGP